MLPDIYALALGHHAYTYIKQRTLAYVMYNLCVHIYEHMHLDIG